MKKAFAMILSLVLVLSLATTAFASTITIVPDAPATGDTPKETYTAYKVFSASFVGENPNGNVSYTIAADSAFYDVVSAYEGIELTEIKDGATPKVYNVEKTESFNAETFAGLLNADTTKPEGKSVSEMTDGNYVIDGLDKGYYLVTTTLGTALILDTTTDQTIIAKNSYPELTKAQNIDTADFGETVTYTVTVTIPDTATGNITVHDVMTDMVYVDMTAQDGVTAVTENLTDNCTVEFVIDTANVEKDADDKVNIVYTATVGAGKAEGKNKAWLTYSEFTSTEKEVTVNNYKFSVKKVDGNNAGLEGAGFVLAETQNDVVKYYDKTEDKVTWVESIDDATQLFPNAAGGYTVTFDGLGNGTYNLIEKTVPVGYNKADDTQVVIEGADKAEAITIVNNTGSELPSTGGVGTTMFYVIGATLMMGAAVLLITKKRVSDF